MRHLEPTPAILEQFTQQAQERDSLQRRVERLNLLNAMATRLADWQRTLEGRHPMSGPTCAEMECIVGDLKRYWEKVQRHR